MSNLNKIDLVSAFSADLTMHFQVCCAINFSEVDWMRMPVNFLFDLDASEESWDGF